jgi:diadenosine tetraphosphate (Ap4A) HIT family hydrolase
MSTEFIVDPRIAGSSAFVLDWPLCQLRLKDDTRFPWLLLLPRRSGVIEYTDLALDDYQLLCAEVLSATRLLQTIRKPDKINVAMLGNVVPQMHVHVIGRFKDDAAWPDAVWCHGTGPRYRGDDLEREVSRCRAVMTAVLAPA